MIKEICNPSMTKNSCWMKFDKKPKNDIDFDKIVKFLNDQKAVLDYVDLN